MCRQRRMGEPSRGRSPGRRYPLACIEWWPRSSFSLPSGSPGPPSPETTNSLIVGKHRWLLRATERHSGSVCTSWVPECLAHQAWSYPGPRIQAGRWTLGSRVSSEVSAASLCLTRAWRTSLESIPHRQRRIRTLRRESVIPRRAQALSRFGSWRSAGHLSQRTLEKSEVVPAFPQVLGTEPRDRAGTWEAGERRIGSSASLSSHFSANPRLMTWHHETFSVRQY